MTDQLKDFSMKLRRAFPIIMLLSLSFISLADDFDDEFNGMNSTMNELDMETGSCIPELKAQTERATKMLALLSKKKSKIVALEGKVDNLTAKLIERSNTQACNTSGLTQQVTDFQLSNAQLRRENTALQLRVAKLQSEITLGQRRAVPTTPAPVAIPVVPPMVSTLDVEETVDADWGTTASHFKNRLGQDFAYTCPAKGSVNNVQGGNKGKYYIGSSVCTAAVHAGLMTVKSGGNVVIRVITNKSGYKSSYRNQIQSSRIHYPKGFIFVN